MRYRLQKLGVLSVARMMAIVNGAISLILIPFMLLIALITAAGAPAEQKFGALVFVVLAVALPFFYAGIGFLMGALVAFVYNLVAGKFGGVEAELVAMPATPAPVPMAPMPPPA